jgi:hypothetical protein
MSIFTRRPIDPARLAEALASRQGWTIERWLEEPERHRGVVRCDAGGPVVPAHPAVEEPGASVAVVVSGGELRGEALLKIALRDTEEFRASDERRSAARSEVADVVSEHLPRRLRAPVLRPAQLRWHRIELVEHPAGGTLHELMARDPALAPGEAVTVLTSVARGLADLHAGGRAGAALGTRDIGFRDDGCPVLTGAVAFRPLDHAAARADIASYAALATRVCAALKGEPAALLLAAATAVGHRSWEDVTRAVLQVADPCAISWTPAATHAEPTAAPLGRSSERDATVLRGSVPASAEAMPGAGPLGIEPTRLDDHLWDPEATLLRSTVRALAQAADAPSSGSIAAPGGPRLPQAGAATGSVADGVAATTRGGPTQRSQTAPSRGRRPRPPSRRTSDGTVGDPARNDPALATLERLLNGIGDRPVGRALDAGRTWIAERPLLIGVAAIPLLCALLALLLMPSTDEADSSMLGPSSPALLRVGGTGPDCDHSEPVTWSL